MGKKVANYTDIQLDIGSKEQFRINGDDSRIIELDVRDLGILTRLQESYPRLEELGIKGFEADDATGEIDDETFNNMVTALNSINKEMCDIINYVFDSDIAETCSNGKPLYSMRSGQFIFEIILDALFGLYSENIQVEFNQMSERMRARTQKYTGNK